MKTLVIVVLVAALIWVTSALVRVENERYALSLGMYFQKDTNVLITDPTCFATVHTRIAWYWHVAYALRLV
jgi:hypothetical protein